MNRVRELVGASYAYERGFCGDGVGVAVLDSGVDASHPDLQGRLCYSYNYLNHTKEMLDDCGHGTHITGIIGGTGAASGGRYQGLAPRCHFVSLKVLDKRGGGSSASVIEALNWILQHGEEYGIRIVNISVGSVAREAPVESALLRSVEEVWDAGFIVCAAAGNQGPQSRSITAPGTCSRVITVGCSDDDHAVQVMGERKIHYSSRGPTRDCICKPEVTAPGSYLFSANAFWKNRGQNLYVNKSGTSMSTPVVSGCIALLLSGEPQMTNAEVKLRLYHSCRDLGLPKSQQGWGMVSVPELLG